MHEIQGTTALNQYVLLLDSAGALTLRLSGTCTVIGQPDSNPFCHVFRGETNVYQFDLRQVSVLTSRTESAAEHDRPTAVKIDTVLQDEWATTLGVFEKVDFWRSYHCI